jgi:N-acetylglucosaminyldiphosphoundecaprenol N-acetyl-beta-D-mannosaminyltransferase
MDRSTILNVAIDNVTLDTLLDQIGSGGFVVTPNVDHLMRLQHDCRFYEAYGTADYCVCDSRIVQYAARLLGQPIDEKISGSDLFPAFYWRYREDPGTTIFLLGAPEGVAAIAQERINAKVGRTMVVGTYSPPMGFEHDATECQRIVRLIQSSGATVLAMGVGAPKQEIWIQRFRSQLPKVRTFLAIGATLNFEAGAVARSPQWMSAAGLEWLYRLLVEPRRLWKRYLVDDLPFFGLILAQWVGQYSNPFADLEVDAVVNASRSHRPVMREPALAANAAKTVR